MLNIPNGDRSQRAHEYHKQIKPFLHSFIQKKEGSRVTQLIYKWGGKEVQASIHQGILQHWKELIKSKYALFMIEKVLKDFEIGQIFDDMILLQNSREGAKVLQSYIEKNPESENVKKMKKKLHGINEKSK